MFRMILGGAIVWFVMYVGWAKVEPLVHNALQYLANLV